MVEASSMCGPVCLLARLLSGAIGSHMDSLYCRMVQFHIHNKQQEIKRIKQKQVNQQWNKTKTLRVKTNKLIIKVGKVVIPMVVWMGAVAVGEGAQPCS